MPGKEDRVGILREDRAETTICSPAFNLVFATEICGAGCSGALLSSGRVVSSDGVLSSTDMADSSIEVSSDPEAVPSDESLSEGVSPQAQSSASDRESAIKTRIFFIDEFLSGILTDIISQMCEQSKKKGENHKKQQTKTLQNAGLQIEKRYDIMNGKK